MWHACFSCCSCICAVYLFAHPKPGWLINPVTIALTHQVPSLSFYHFFYSQSCYNHIPVTITLTHTGTIILVIILVWASRLFIQYATAVQEEQKAKEHNRELVCLRCGSPDFAPKEQVQGVEGYPLSVDERKDKDKEEQPLLQGAAVKSDHHC
mgnify:CR=1 FL=1